jgi:arylsulfatase A-like enzyme
MDDQHRGDCLGAAGADWLDTPNLDSLAQQGALFTRGYSSLPSCLPARASILTGLRAWNHGLLSFLAIPNKFKVEMPQLFTDAGYRTHVCGKNHFYGAKHGYQTTEVEEIYKPVDAQGRPLDDYLRWFADTHDGINPFKRDKDYYDPGFIDHRGHYVWPFEESSHPTHWTADRAIAFLNTHSNDKPWFLKVSFHRPHPPFDAPKRFADKYKKRSLPKPKTGQWSGGLFGHQVGSVYTTPSSLIGRYPDHEVHESRAAYYAGIDFVDEQLGRVLDALKNRGELENTLILFTSDHGDMMGDHYLWRKYMPYEGSARVPFIIRWPEALRLKAKRGQILDHLVELRDIMPTFLDAAGLPIPANIDGQSMLDILRGNAKAWRTELDLEHGQTYFRENGWVALTDAQYKYIYFTATGDQLLFDLKQDPYETKDLAADPKKKTLLLSWRKKMIAFLSERGEPWVKDGDLALQPLRARYGPNYQRVMVQPPDAEPYSRFFPEAQCPTLAEYSKAQFEKANP